MCKFLHLECGGGIELEAYVMNKKIVFRKPFDLDYEYVQLSRDPDDNDVLIKSHYSVISPGTELALFTGTHVGIPDPNNTFAKYPFYPGYSVVGEVVAVGKNVRGFVPGDRVYTVGKHSSYNVSPCNSFLVPLIKVPEGVPMEQAPFAKLGMICLTAIVQSRIAISDTVVVIGLGPIGNIAAQLYSLMGARVIGVDLVASRVEIARRAGIDEVILLNPSTDLKEAVQEVTGGKEPDIVVEATGSPDLIVPSLDLVRKLGQVIALGATRGKVPEFNIYEYVQRKGVHLVGALEGLATLDGFPSREQLTRYAFKLILKGALHIEPLITHKLRAEQAAHAYDLLLNHKDQAFGVLFDWTE